MSEKTAEEMFGTEPPGEPVKPREPTHLAGYQPRRRWTRRGDNKPVILDRREHPETQDNTRKD